MVRRGAPAEGGPPVTVAIPACVEDDRFLKAFLAAWRIPEDREVIIDHIESRTTGVELEYPRIGGQCEAA
jgi:hypothetical protein